MQAKPMRTGITITYVRQDLLALLLALVVGTTLVGIFVAQYPGVGTALVPTLVIGEIALLWLLKNSHARAIVGALVFITILRPWPNVGNPSLTGRAVDLVWLFIAIAFSSRGAVGSQTSEVTHNSDA